MSSLTPIWRDISGDDGMTQYKIKYLQQRGQPRIC